MKRDEVVIKLSALERSLLEEIRDGIAELVYANNISPIIENRQGEFHMYINATGVKD